MNTINEDIKPYKGKGAALSQAFGTDGGVGSLLDAIEAEIAKNPLMALAKIRKAMEDFSKGRVKACLETAAERMEKNAPKWYEVGSTRYFSAAKFTITNPENII